MKLLDILQKTTLLKDVQKLSPYQQTSSVESFHKILIHFAPKMFHFGYKGMMSRYVYLRQGFLENELA